MTSSSRVDAECERSVLYALTHEPQGTWPVLAEHYSRDLFAAPGHQVAAEAAAQRLRRGAPVDPVLVAGDLADAGERGAAAAFLRAVQTTHNVVNVPYHIRRLAALRDARGAPQQPPGTDPVLEARAIFAPLPPVRWLCEALDAAPGAPLLIAGYGFSGKTVAAQDLALAVASGTPVWGSFPVRRGRVLHVDYEQGAHLTRGRYQRLARARGLNADSLEGRLRLVPMPGWYLDSDPDDELARLCEGWDLVIIDSFRAAAPHTDENDSEARVPLDRLTRLSERTGILPAVIHHARKPPSDGRGGRSGGARMTVRGSGALFDACGSVLVFAGEKNEPATVEHEKARISGRVHESFRLWIEDVELGGDPRAGLRVSTLAGPAAKSSAPARFVEAKAKILEFVQAEVTTGGVNVLRARLGLRKEDVSAAVDELVREGSLFRGGSVRNPTLSVQGTIHDG